MPQAELPQMRMLLVASSLTSEWFRLRSHKRILASSELVVQWEENGTPRSLAAWTVDVSYSGCLADVRGSLKLGQTVRLINKRNGLGTEASVVWQDPKIGAVGFALRKPNADFWDLGNW